MNRLLLPLLLASSAVFAQDAVPTVRICDSSGCSDRPRDSASFQPEATDPVAEQRLLQLTEVARDDPRAAYDLGLRYFRGDGVRQDSYQALKWMRDAGERGVVPAQLALGRFYLMGLEEMGPDPAEAETWLSMAAAKATMHRQEVVSHNLANVSTNGFRAELSTYRAVPLQGDGASTRVMALEATAGHLETPGTLNSTGRNLDVAAIGNAYFAVQGLDGLEAYTRAGNLQVAVDGTLTSATGLPMLDEGGAPIERRATGVSACKGRPARRMEHTTIGSRRRRTAFTPSGVVTSAAA